MLNATFIIVYCKLVLEIAHVYFMEMKGYFHVLSRCIYNDPRQAKDSDYSMGPSYRYGKLLISFVQLSAPSLLGSLRKRVWQRFGPSLDLAESCFHLLVPIGSAQWLSNSGQLKVHLCGWLLTLVAVSSGLWLAEPHWERNWRLLAAAELLPAAPILLLFS